MLHLWVILIVKISMMLVVLILRGGVAMEHLGQRMRVGVSECVWVFPPDSAIAIPAVLLNDVVYPMED